MRIAVCSILILFFCITALFGANPNMEKIIKNRIFEDLNLTFNINNIDLNDIIIEKNSLPSYRLFEIQILEKEQLKNNYVYSVKISDFLNSSEYKILNIEIPAINQSILKSRIKINDQIKILIFAGNIEVIDSGKIKKVMPDGRLIVQNTFGKLLECRLLSGHQAAMVIK